MSENADKRLTANGLVIVAALVIVVAGLRAAAPIIVPFLFAVFIAIVAAPSMLWLREKGLPHWLALVLVLFGLSIIGFLLSVMLGSSFSEFSSQLPQYQQQLQSMSAKLITWVSQFGIVVSAEQVTNIVNPSAVMRFANNTLSSFGSVLSNLALISIAAMFILLEVPAMRLKIHAVMNDPEHYLGKVNEFVLSVKNYMVIKTVISFFTGLFVAIALWFIGVDFPVLWGLLAFILNYVPNIGWIISAVPAVLMSLINLGPGPTTMVIIAYSVINFVLGNLVEPRVMGRGVGLSTLVVFMSLVFWGWVLGPVGMILCVPLTMLAKIALQGNEGTQWIALLLGTEEEALNRISVKNND